MTQHFIINKTKTKQKRNYKIISFFFLMFLKKLVLSFTNI